MKKLITLAILSLSSFSFQSHAETKDLDDKTRFEQITKLGHELDETVLEMERKSKLSDTNIEIIWDSVPKSKRAKVNDILSIIKKSVNSEQSQRQKEIRERFDLNKEFFKKYNEFQIFKKLDGGIFGIQTKEIEIVTNLNKEQMDILRNLQYKYSDDYLKSIAALKEKHANLQQKIVKLQNYL